MMRFAVLDTETTGFGPKSGVCEIAYLEFDPSNMDVIRRGYSLIDPETPITPGASGVHGITDEDVADSPTLKEYFNIVEGRPFDGGEMVIVAHKADYDMQYVGPHINNLAGTICTLKCARRIYPDADDHKLQTLRYALKLNVEAADAHSAAGDVEVCFALLKRLMQDSGLGLEGLIEMSKLPGILKMPFGKHKGVRLADLPADYVHWLLNKAEIKDDLRAAVVATCT